MSTQWRDDIPLNANPWKFFLFSSKPHWKSAFVAMVAVLVASLLNASIPYIFKIITNAAAALSHGGSYGDLFFGAWAYVIVTTISELGWRTSGFAGANWATRSRATARYALSSYVTLHSRAYFSDRFAGSLANKISRASNGMRDIVEYILWKIGEFIISIIASIAIAFYVNSLLGGLLLGWVTIVVIFNAYFGSKRMPLAAHAQELETKLTGATVDLLGNVSAMQEFARRPFELDRIRELTDERTKAGLYNWRYGERLLTFNGLVQAVFGALMVFTALRLAAGGIISTGDIVLIVAMIFRMRDQMLFIGSHLHHLAETWGEIQESLKEIIEPHEITDMAEAMRLSVSKGEITFEKAIFSYTGQSDVLADFSLQIPGRQKVGLVGKSGAGKSTLIKLLLRHYELSSGSIAIDGQEINAITQDSLRENIAVVPQEPLLFHRSLSENIAYGKPGASESEIEHAAGLAQAHEFITQLPQGYETLVGERGIKLSGGERQRVAIARAILKDAPILILDEATASLDSESEVAIQKALHELMIGKTVIAIAHRLSTLREMDRIIVLDGGKIVQEGTHDELLEKGGIYADLWRHQAGGFLQDE